MPGSDRSTPRVGFGLPGLVVVLGERFELREGCSGLHLGAGRDQQLPEPRPERRLEHGLHLHALQHEHGRARLHLGTHLDRGGDHQGGGRRPQHATLVPGDPVGDTVHLDHVDRTVGRGHQPEPLVGDQQAGGVRVQALQVGVDHLQVPVRADADAVPVRTRPRHRHLVGHPAQLEPDGPADLVLHLRAPAVSGLEQPQPLDLLLVPVRLDRGCDQCHAGVLVRDQAALPAYAVDPARVRSAVPHLRLVEQVEQEALVGGAAVDDHGGLVDRAAQARQRLLPVTSVGDDLGDHRVELGRDGVALAHARVDPDPRPGG